MIERTRGRIKLAAVVAGDHVLTHRGRFRRVLAVHRQGELPLLKITTEKGRVVRAAPDHPFLTPDGWVQARDLTCDHVLGVVVPPECGGETVAASEARLLGYLIGDGCVLYSSVGVTNDDPAVLGDVVRCAKSLGFGVNLRRKSKSTATYVAINGGDWRKGAARGRLGPVQQWLRSHDLAWKSIYTKRVPLKILAGSRYLVAQFLGAYWSCDGFVAKRSGERTDMIVGADTVSEGLARDVQHLLLRIGISARVRRKETKLESKRQPGGRYISWQVVLSSAGEITKFAKSVPMEHAKKRQLAHLDVRSTFDRCLVEDQVVSVEADGRGVCRCLTVDEDHSFTAGDIAVKNSLSVSVFWPAWEWIRRPEARFLTASHAETLAVRDARKHRLLCASPWYQGYWGDRIAFSRDQNAKTRFENTRRGYRVVTSTNKGIGEGGNHIIVDDPHTTKGVLSDAMRVATLDWWKETASQRQRPPGSGARIVIMQRLHHDDLSGHLMREGGWVHLMLPAEYEPERHCTTVPLPSTGGQPWEDWRTREGELLWPELFDHKVLVQRKRELGSTFAIAGQLQQRPSPKGGGIVKADWWQMWEKAEYPVFDMVIASVDTAMSEDEQNAMSACTVWGVYRTETGVTRIMLVYAWEDRLEFNALVEKISWTAKRFGSTHMLIEKKANGASVAQELRRRRLGPKGMSVIEVNPMGDKVARLTAVSGMFESKFIYAPDKSWANNVIDRCAGFPAVAMKDLVDTVSQGVMWLRQRGLQLYPEDQTDESYVPPAQTRGGGAMQQSIY